MALEVGVKAPDFVGETNEKSKVTLKDYVGKWVVLYFYPKDNTSGCTKEACYFRDSMADITKIGAIVLGVSPDSTKSHESFAEKFNLNFSIVSDPDKTICNLYDVMAEKSMYGKKYIGVERTTYIINKELEIAFVFRKVKVEGHTQEVIDKLMELQK